MARTRNADRRRYWQEAIERQQASGQSIVGFCTEEGVSTASFHAWKRRFRRLAAGSPPKSDRSKPLCPCRSSATPWLAWERWKSSGQAVSCCGSVAVIRRRSVRLSLPSRLPRYEGRDDVDAPYVAPRLSPRQAPRT